ncbi:acetate/propionate family kinase [Candidatus Micrarchaeota archaeon]|nr:acetate/propionate family kinase [Candidatus Micrarchaeota archaeon]
MKEMMILTLNVGSSSVKFATFKVNSGRGIKNKNIKRIADGEARGLWEKPIFNLSIMSAKKHETKEKIMIKRGDYQAVIYYIVKKLIENRVIKDINDINAVCHRVVHGGEKYINMTRITNSVIKGIEKLSDLAPLHNPINLLGIHAARNIFPNAEHIAVFDTQFHSSMDKRFYLYPIPLKLYKRYGIRRYGFHGTSHKYVYEKAREIYKSRFSKRANNDKYNDFSAIILHLGNGASATAIKNGKVITTSMGLTPLEGLIMGTRSGDIDPGVIIHLVNHGFTVEEVYDILNKQSGLKAMTGTNEMKIIQDMYEDAIRKEKRIEKEKIELALNMYTDRIVKYVSWYYVLLKKPDVIVFTAGIGEHSPLIRAMILDKLKPLGIEYSKIRNRKNQMIISPYTRSYGKKRIKNDKSIIMVIPTDEELEMVREYIKWRF